MRILKITICFSAFILSLGLFNHASAVCPVAGKKRIANLFYSFFFAIFISLFFISPAYGATEVVRTIKPSGQGGDYTTLAAWEAGEQKDLVAADEIAVAQIDGDWSTPDTTAVTIEGWTTDATRYIKIYTTAQARHSGKWETDRYRLEHTGNSSTIAVYEEYVRIDGLQIKKISTGNQWPSGLSIGINNIVSDVQVSNNIIRADLTGLTNYGLGINRGYNTSLNAKLWNNIIYNWTGGSGGSDTGIMMTTGAGFNKNFYIYNNTIYNCDIGFGSGDARTVAILKNNIAYNNVDNYGNSYSALSANNLSGPGADLSMPATNKRDGVSVAFSDETNGDFHLASNDTGAKGYGADLSDDPNLPFQEDIDGGHRGGDPDGSPWDIGADEAMGAVVNSPDLPGGSKMKINMSLTDKNTDGLVGMWSFDGPDINWADTTSEAKDRSGNNNNGDVSGATAVAGKRGQALSFDGGGDHISLGSPNSLFTSSGSVCAWVKTGSDTPQTILGLDGDTTNAFSIVIGDGVTNSLTNELVTVAIGNIVNRIGYTTANRSELINNQWHQVCLTSNGSSYGIYIDGGSKAISIGAGANDGKWTDSRVYTDARIGTSNYWITQNMNGQLDEVRIYNRALSEDEVGDLYRLGQVTIRR